MTEFLRATLEDLAADAPLPADLASGALALARIRRRRVWLASAAATVFAGGGIVAAATAIPVSGHGAAPVSRVPGIALPSRITINADAAPLVRSPIGRSSIVFETGGEQGVAVDPAGRAYRAVVAPEGREIYLGDASPVLSPDGLTVATSFGLPSMPGDDALTYPGEVRLQDMATGATTTVPIGGPRIFESLAWAPDGSALAGEVATRDPESGNYSGLGIGLFDVASGHFQLLADTSDAARSSAVAWSPDSRSIAYSTEVGVSVVDLTRGVVRALPTPQGASQDLPDAVAANGWSPDGRVLAIRVSTAEREAIIFVDPQTGAVQPGTGQLEISHSPIDSASLVLGWLNASTICVAPQQLPGAIRALPISGAAAFDLVAVEGTGFVPRMAVARDALRSGRVNRVSGSS